LTGTISSNRDVISGVDCMTGDARKNDDGTGEKALSNQGSTPTDEAALSAGQDQNLDRRLGQLNDRLSAMRDSRKASADLAASGDSASARASGMAVGLRLSSELVAGVIVGSVLGWGFDRLLSTSPWGLIVFMLLGFVAGVINVMRSAGVGSRK
jgi:ATP synthase protein I